MLRRHFGPENLSNQSFSAISANSAADLPARHDSQARDRAFRRPHDDRQVAAVRPPAAVEDALEFGPAPETPARRQGKPHGRSDVSGNA